MVYHKKNRGEVTKNVKFKRSMLAMCVMALSAPSFAADAPKKDEGAVEEIVVSGMREALSSAQEIKRNADTVVESITAKDLGAFPDKSVAEALQRVAGITVNRFAASSDTAHFSAEPSGVVVRGLNQVRTEFNGRDSFSANSSRGLSWGDVSPELMSGVDTYKNQTAELIEGGIAGTVNMRTRTPFDQAGDMKALSLDANYGSLSQKYTPEISGLYSTRWDTSAGEMGVLVNATHSKVTTGTNGTQLGRMDRYQGVYTPLLNYIPESVSYRENTYDRVRDGAALAAQWKNTDGTLQATLQYNSSKYQNSMQEYVVTAGTENGDFGLSTQNVHTSADPLPLDPAQPFIFGSNGLFQSGTMTRDIGWWGADNAGSAKFASNASGQQLVNACYGWNGCSPSRRGGDIGTATRASTNTNKTQDFGFNLKWDPSDTLHGSFDLQYVKSTVTNYDIETDFSSFANVGLDLTGRLPALTLTSPTNINLSSGGTANPDNYYIRAIMDHLEDSKGHELAFRSDFKIDIDSGWINNVKVGARYAERDQTVNWTAYNWQNVANTWTSNVGSGYQSAYFNLDKHSPDAATGFKGYPQGYYTTRTFNNNYGTINAKDFVFANMSLIQNRQALASTMSATALGLTGGTGWDPICSNIGDRITEVKGTCFTPAETAQVNEKTEAVYVQLDFGGSDAKFFNTPVSGNIGIREIHTSLESIGGTAFPLISASNLDTSATDPTATPPPPLPFKLGHYLYADDIAFQNGASQLNTITHSFNNMLPSFNLKFDLSDEVLLRFALSRAMSRPDMGNLKNYVGIGATFPTDQNLNNFLWVKDSTGKITNANVYYKASAQNPMLKPITADQLDISLEYYFAKVGSVTFTAFAKNFNDYIQIGSQFLDYTNNGVTKTIEVNRPLNGDGAGIKGFEFAFQRFFDFLPAPFDGLGMQANFTRIINHGIATPGVTNVGAGGTTITGQAPDSIKTTRLEGLPDDSANMVLMYEKNSWAARVAYSWRSEVMVTAIDCCVSYPIWNQASGQLDASVKYKFNDNIEISLSGSNLLNEQTVLMQQVSDSDKGGLRLPNATFENDVRYTLGLRLKY